MGIENAEKVPLQLGGTDVPHETSAVVQTGTDAARERISVIAGAYGNLGMGHCRMSDGPDTQTHPISVDMLYVTADNGETVILSDGREVPRELVEDQHGGVFVFTPETRSHIANTVRNVYPGIAAALDAM